MKNCLSIFFLMFFFYSCSSSSLNVDFHIPMTRSFSPETLGEQGMFGIMGAYHSNHQVSVMRSHQSASIFSSTPSAVVIDQESQSTVSSGMGVQGSLGIFSRLDVFLAKNNEAPFEAGLQWQFLGEQGSKGTGLKASIWGSVGFQEDNEDESTTSFGDNSSKLDNVEAKTEIASRAIGILLGHRFNDKWLVFTQFLHQFYAAETDLKVTGGVSVNKKIDTEQNAASLGFRLGQADKALIFFQLEGGISTLRVQRGPTDTHRSLAATVGANF